MSDDCNNEGGGTLIRAPDGSLYLIPDEKLKAFAVPEKVAREVQAKLFNGDTDLICGTVRGKLAKIFMPSESTATSTVLNLAALRPWPREGG